MLSLSVADEAIELLVASLYTTPYPHVTAPGSGFAGFYRFLSLVANHDWVSEPLVVSTDALTVADKRAAVERFTASRHDFPPMTIFTANDAHESLWTANNPSSHILARLVRLARASLGVFDRCLSSAALDAADPRTVFRADTAVYDALIHVKRAAVPRAPQRLWAADAADTAVARDGRGSGSTYVIAHHDFFSLFPTTFLDVLDSQKGHNCAAMMAQLLLCRARGAEPRLCLLVIASHCSGPQVAISQHHHDQTRAATVPSSSPLRRLYRDHAFTTRTSASCRRPQCSDICIVPSVTVLRHLYRRHTFTAPVPQSKLLSLRVPPCGVR